MGILVICDVVLLVLLDWTQEPELLTSHVNGILGNACMDALEDITEITA